MTTNKTEGKILIVDDNKSVLHALSMLLKTEFDAIQTLPGPVNLLATIDVFSPDVVLLDMNFKAGESSGNEGLYWLREIKKKHPAIEVVMFTAYGEVDLAVTATREGAADFVVKPWDNEKLLATLRAAYRVRQSSMAVDHLQKRNRELTEEINRDDRMIIGVSAAMKRVMDVVKKVARTDANVMITGENGTGKELVAKEIHRLSDRSDSLLVTVDLGSITETLFESEMFGHAKGAFTDAIGDRTGKVVLADKGTLLLDEIGNLPMHLQAKLLNVLQNRLVIPVGANTEIPVDIRLICTTNKNLPEMVAQKGFRQDLLYRINTIHLELPPLRKRREDIEILASFFTDKYGRKYKKEHLTIEPGAMVRLRQYDWPGNIRELQHTIEKGVILCEGTTITEKDLYLTHYETVNDDETLTLEQMEIRMIRNELTREGKNLTVVARNLGISRPTLYKKMKKYGL